MNNIFDPHVYNDNKYADFFINKETEYHFSGSNLTFLLSHALFSSYEVDSGSRLLLKTLVPVIRENSIKSILDAGCGTGVLGTALKKTVPDAELDLYDRDSLAVYFTELNLVKNCITGYRTANSLLMFPFSEKKYDLIVSNLPAKAGREVLGDFIQQAPMHLTENGFAAVVIVEPLSDFAAETIEKNSLYVLKTVKTANYSVFIFKYPAEKYRSIIMQHDNKESLSENLPVKGELDNKIDESLEKSGVKNISVNLHIKSDEELFSSYIRQEKQLFEIKGQCITIDTATGLPDFNTLSFNSKLTSELILSIKESLKTDFRQLVINPGQGLVPVLLDMLNSDQDSEREVLISSNDYLQLKMTERNLKSVSPSEVRVFINSPTFFHTSDSIEQGSLDTIVYFYTPVPCFKKHDLIIRRLNTLLKKDGKLILTSTASEISRFLSSSRGFVNVKGKKNKGIRSVYLKKTAEA